MPNVRLSIVFLVILCSCSGSDSNSPSEPGPPAVSTLAVIPELDTLARGQTRVIEIIVKDAAGNRLPSQSIDWTTSDSTVATVERHPVSPNQNGVITAVSPGSATVTASGGGKIASLKVVVVPFGTVARVVISPGASLLGIGMPYRFSAVSRDVVFNDIPNKTVTWTTSNASVATVDQSGVVSGVSDGTATITATVEAVSGTVDVTVIPVTSTGAFTSVATGGGTACALNASGKAFCWGEGASGQLGNDLKIRSTFPVPVSGNLSFASIVPGAINTCALTSAGKAYCWGRGNYSANGDGSSVERLAPVAVSGPQTFREIAVGSRNVCALSTENDVFCWGDAEFGALGTGATATVSIPAAISGNLKFKGISTKFLHACALAADGTAYCWGDNRSGAIGNGTTGNIVSLPAPVSGGKKFSSIKAGETFTCAIDTEGAAWCWGSNFLGQLGNGTLTASTVPVAVSGGLRFTSIAVGNSHTCGIRDDGDVYCWGLNDGGNLANGKGANSQSPTPVLGGLKFVSLTAGTRSTCGITNDGKAYCWGPTFTSSGSPELVRENP
ncbi:MAG TPA: Ig-like domain-containing protein [Gemmatimonadaceae bacterium]|nr:Ig-like domain-containing protein [Gemmatimonadaceae bacterium]